MNRNALEYIKSWYVQSGRKPLMIRGARQVGKSYLVREFARQAGVTLLEINFEKNPELKTFFSTSIQKTCEFLEVHFKTKIEPGKTLLFLDEIQAAPSIIPLLRYFYEEVPDLRVVAAGSLLEFVLQDHSFSMPVGRVEYLYLGPMTFEEFLEARGESTLKKMLESFDLSSLTSWPLPFHQKLMEYVRLYLLTGGMPEVVQCFVKNVSQIAAHELWDQCGRIKQSILTTYQDDFSKYRNRVPDVRMRKVFQKIPRLIGEKFKYVNVDPDEKAKDLGQALHLLCMAYVVCRVSYSFANGVPLGAETDDKFFKTLFLDVGLVSSVCGLGRLDFEKEDLNLINDGKISEQFVGQHLFYEGAPYQTPELYYWAREKKNAAAEVDYVASLGEQVIPIEVKSGKTGTLRSLHLFLKEKKLPLGIRFNSEPPTVLKEKETTLISLPFYLVGQWRRFVR